MSGTVAEGLRRVQAALSGAPDPAREARILLAHAMGVERDRLTLLAHDDLSAEAFAAALALAKRRAGGEPVSHLIGYRAFFGRRFRVTPDVLDPRPETEALVLAALEVPFTRVLDLGTGSGAILLSLLAERAEAAGIGTDLSAAALAVARANAAALGVGERASFLESDWFSEVEGRFDLIVSNPPYIALDEMPGLARELSHEPRMALTDEADGLSAYRAITRGGGAHLDNGGFLMVEIGWQQGRDVAALFAEAGFQTVTILPDLDGRDRVVTGRLPA